MADTHVLLTPGPCMTSNSVRQAASMPDLNHREPAYLEMFDEVRGRLLTLYDAPGWAVCLIGGSGTAAVEAMVSSCIGSGRALVITNGYYSERIVDLLEVHRIPYDQLRFGWRDAWDFRVISQKLSSEAYEAVVCVHNETTTGRLNDISKLADLCRRHGARCLVDAMSSFGVEEMNFTNLDAVASSANKCLHGIPGVSFVMMSSQMAAAPKDSDPRTYYLSLKRYLEADTPLTPPVPAIAALHEALREMDSLAKRRARYADLNGFIRAELELRGMRTVIPREDASITLTTYYAPGDAAEWIEQNRRRGYLLYGCKGELAATCFQVANMGELSHEHIRGWLKVVDTLIPGGG